MMLKFLFAQGISTHNPSRFFPLIAFLGMTNYYKAGKVELKVISQGVVHVLDLVSWRPLKGFKWREMKCLVTLTQNDSLGEF